MVEGRAYPILSTILKYLSGIFFATMLAANLIKADREMIWTGLFFVLCVIMVFLLYRIILRFLGKRKNYRILAAGGILFVLAQIAVMLLISTTMEWDPGTVITMAGQWARGDALFWPEYFGYSPNNLILLIFFRLIFSVTSLFTGYMGDILAAILVNIIVVDLSVFLMVCCAGKMYGKRGQAAALAIGILTIGISPWLCVPYSDTLGMIFPVLLLFLYLYGIKEGRHTAWTCVLMGASTAVGYMIKPHVVIILIAIIIVDFFSDLRNSERLRAWGRRLLITLLSLAIVFAGVDRLSCYASRNIISDEMREEKLPFTHFIMMGLNEVTYGSFYSEDSNATHGIHGEENKKEYNKKVIKERLQEYGPGGYLRFLGIKVTRIYTDGTFNFDTEGDFSENVKIFDLAPAKALQEIYHIDGKYYAVSSSFFNSMWLMLLAAIALAGLLPDKQGNREIDVLRLTIAGLTVFLLLVEGRARYLYHLLPVFILLAVYGMLLLSNVKRGFKKG